MARRCYPPIKIPGTSLAGDPAAYWDFCTLDTEGEGTQPPVAWTHGANVVLDDDGTPVCVTPAAYYDQSSTAKSEQGSTLYTNATATWLIVFRFDGTPAVGGSPPTYGQVSAIISKASPGTPGASQYGFVLYGGQDRVGLHLKAGSGTTIDVATTITPANTVIAAAFSFDTTSFRMSCNGTASADRTSPTGFSIGNYPLLIGNRADTYWGIFKGHISRVATWQGVKATASELNKLTTMFADGCAPGFLQRNSLMFSCNS